MFVRPETSNNCFLGALGDQYWDDEPTGYPTEMVSLFESLVVELQKTRDLIILETGISRGYVTRPLAHLMRPEHDLYWCYDMRPEWRMELSIRDFWVKHLSTCLKDHPTPTPEEMSIADLVIVTHPGAMASAELFLWQAMRKPDSTLFTRQAFGGHDTIGDAYVYGDTELARQVWSATVEQTVSPV